MGLTFWLVVAPLIAAILILLIPKANVVLYRLIGTLGVFVSLLIALSYWGGFNPAPHTFQHVTSFSWFTLPNVWLGSDLTIGLSFGVDGLSLPLLMLAIIVSLFAIASVKTPLSRGRLYYFWLSIVSMGLFGVFTALDLFTFLVALETTLFSSFFLIYLFGETGRRAAAFKFLIYRGLATIFLLVAFIGLAYGIAGGLSPHASELPPFAAASTSSQQGQLALEMLQSAGVHVLTFNIPTLLQAVVHTPTSVFPEAWRIGLLVVLLFAVFIEEAFVPFHTWLPTTHEVADTGTNMMIGGVLTKTGAYVLLRFGVGLLPSEVHWAAMALGIIGVINILYGAFAAWAQNDWRRLIAFSSISHMGLVLLAIAALNSAGLQGAMFMLVSSGLLTALLFYIVGSLKQRTESTMMQDLGGLSKSMPVLSGFLMVGALGSLGLPLTSGFISEIQSFIGGFGTFPVISAVGVLGMILSAVYLLYAIQKTTFGHTSATHLQLADARLYEYVPIGILTILILVIGIYPDILATMFGSSVHALLRIGG